MPKEVFDRDYAFLPRDQLLTFEEIARLVRVFARLGVRKVRITGGEPLLRRGVERLVAMLAAIEELEDLTLTSNGALLGPKAGILASAGLKRVTVSLDSLDDATFREMNGVDFPVARVLEGIEAAAVAGLVPLKVNTVIKRGANDAAVEQMADHFRGTGHVVRFIEYMDVGSTNGWRLGEVVPAAEIVERIDARWPLEPINPSYRGEVARRFRYRDGAGEIGVIGSVTQPFCGDCTRARLSAEGRPLHVSVRHGRRRPPFRAPLRGRRRRVASPRARCLGTPDRPILRGALWRSARPAQGGDELHRRLRPSVSPLTRGDAIRRSSRSARIPREHPARHRSQPVPDPPTRA